MSAVQGLTAWLAASTSTVKQGLVVKVAKLLDARVADQVDEHTTHVILGASSLACDGVAPVYTDVASW